MKWIPLNAQRPTEGQVVFALLENKFPDVLKYINESFCTLDGLEEESVSHWLPIPTLSKEKKLFNG